MVIDFSKVDLRKRPNFILRNLDGTAIVVLGHVLSPKAKLYYNELSSIEFSYPSQIGSGLLNEYDLLTGMRIVDVEGYGQFLLHNPEETDNGIVRIKKCTAYSLEYEFQNKTLTLEETTYNFWNPLIPDGTILGIILEEMPSWSIGTISTDLIGKYRTFSIDGRNIYDFMKSDLQETYECVFDFDTYQRKINVISKNDTIPVNSVYLSTQNLAKEIKINENLDDLVTVLDVNGAEGVDIRSVNPMGVNKIYNLDAYMSDGYFSSAMISKWNQWKETFESYQTTYYNLVIAQNMQISSYYIEYAVLGDLQGELTSLESQKAALLQAVNTDASLQPQLNQVNKDIAAKETEIANQRGLMNTIQYKIDAYTEQLQSINQATAFSTFFSGDELLILDRYFRCGSLTDSSFVASSIDSYATDSGTVRDLSCIFNLEKLTTLRKSDFTTDIIFYTIRGGTIEESSSALQLEGQIINGTLQVNSDQSFVASLYMGEGSINGSDFPSGTLSLTGKLRSNIVTTDTTLQFATSNATAYMTYEVSEYQRMAIEWDLYEYARELLEKKASPTYSFSVDCADFFAVDDFLSFAQEFTLGERLYLHLSPGVLTPTVLGVEIEFDDLSKLNLEFGTDFKMKDGYLEQIDDLSKATTMGNALDYNQFNYSSFVNSGANTKVKSFMQSALDTMKNRVLSGEHEQITIDEAGIRCRKYDESSGGYSPKQLWIAHNAFMFTNDNWDSAVIGIGEFEDKNLGSLYGVVAPALVGTILAGSNLIIESEKADGGIAVFKVDGEGASLHNASFNLYSTTGGRIDIGSVYGIVAGANKNTLFYYNSNGQPTGVRTKNGNSIRYIDDIDSDDEPNANFWLDMNGNAYYKGTILARDGYIGGWTLEDEYLYSGSGTTYVALNASTSRYSQYAFWAGAASPTSAPFWVKKNGDMSARNGIFSGTLTGSNSYPLSLQGTLSAANTDSWLEGCGIRVGANNDATNGYNFYVDTLGNLSLEGSINLSHGSITWGTNTPVKYQFSVNGTSNWHDTMTASDLYRRDSLDGGKTWGAAYQFRGTDGKDGEDGSDASVTRANIVAAMLDYIEEDGLYTTEINGKQCLGINATAIKTGRIDSVDIYGRTFHNAANSFKDTWIELGSSKNSLSGCAFVLRNTDWNSYPLFNIYDADILGTSFESKGTFFLLVEDWHTKVACPQGTWNFKDATVTNLNVTAKFG